MQISNTHLAESIDTVDKEAQYDENAKKLIADKQVLARIAKYRTKEFKDYDIPSIIECIEGEPEISKTTVHVSDSQELPISEAIEGMNTESTIPGEGKVSFDVRFYMLPKDGARIKIILNIELQKQYHQKYHFEPRAVFYCARMISEQLHREFTAENYDGLKKVYSIWIFFDVPQKYSDTITEYYLEKKDVHGVPVDDWKHDYISISFIRLSSTKEKNSKHQLINMLDTLFSDELSVKNKKNILEQKHQMQMTRELEGGIDIMCNVSQGIKEKAYNEGIAKGVRALINTCRELNLSQDEIIKRLMKEFSITKEIALEFFN